MFNHLPHWSEESVFQNNRDAIQKTITSIKARQINTKSEFCVCGGTKLVSGVCSLTVINSTWMDCMPSPSCMVCLDPILFGKAKVCNRCRHNRKSAGKNKIRNLIWDDCSGICYLCDLPMIRDWVYGQPLCFTVDHVIPKASGGADDINNLRGAHYHCNDSKNDRHLEDLTDEWRARRIAVTQGAVSPEAI